MKKSVLVTLVGALLLSSVPAFAQEKSQDSKLTQEVKEASEKPKKEKTILKEKQKEIAKKLQESKKEREKAEKDRTNGKSSKSELVSSRVQELTTESYDHSIDWSNWDYADVIVGNGPSSGSSNSVPYGYYRHAATYDGRSEDFISAMPDEGVYRETQNFWETEYREVAGYFASSANSTQRVAAVQYLRDQIGEPYLWNSSKTNYSEWYCSKLPYVGYSKKVNLDIDTDGGYWVFPDDIAEDNDMDLFMSSEA